MDQHLGVGMRRTLGIERIGVDALVHMALAHPDLDLPVGPHPPHVGAQEEVGQEQDAPVFRHGIDHVQHVATGAAVVQLRLHRCSGIHVPHRHVAGELLAPPDHVLGVDRRGQRAPRLEVRQQDPLVGREDRRGLRHEVDPAEHDHRLLDRGRLA